MHDLIKQTLKPVASQGGFEIIRMPCNQDDSYPSVDALVEIANQFFVDRSVLG